MGDLIVYLNPPEVMVGSRKLRGETRAYPVEMGAMHGGIVEDDEAIEGVLKDIVLEHTLKGHKPKSITWLLPEDSIAETVLTLPRVSRSDTKIAINRAISEWLGANTPPVSIRWKLVDKSYDEMMIYAAAVRSDVLESLQDLSDISKLKVKGFYGLTPLLCEDIPGGDLVLHASISGQITAVVARNNLPAWIWRESIIRGEDPVRQLVSGVSACKEDGFIVSKVWLSGVADNPAVIQELQTMGYEVESTGRWPDDIVGGLPKIKKRTKIDFGKSGESGIRRTTAIAIMISVLLIEGSAGFYVWKHTQTKLETIQAEVNSLASQTSVTQEMTNEIRYLQSQIDMLEQETQEIRQEDNKPNWEELFAQVQRLATTVNVSTITPTKSETGNWWLVSLDVKAPSITEGFRFIRSLEKPPFELPYVGGITISESGEVGFSVKVRWVMP